MCAYEKVFFIKKKGGGGGGGGVSENIFTEVRRIC